MLPLILSSARLESLNLILPAPGLGPSGSHDCSRSSTDNSPQIKQHLTPMTLISFQKLGKTNGSPKTLARINALGTDWICTRNAILGSTARSGNSVTAGDHLLKSRFRTEGGRSQAANYRCRKSRGFVTIGSVLRNQSSCRLRKDHRSAVDPRVSHCSRASH